MLLKALGGQAGSGHLTPIIYRPIVSFTDAVGHVRASAPGLAAFAQLTGQQAAGCCAPACNLRTAVAPCTAALSLPA